VNIVGPDSTGDDFGIGVGIVNWFKLFFEVVTKNEY
jgi:hypothetical protein